MFKRLCLAAVAVTSMFVLQACAPSCDDACDNIASCAEEFGQTTTDADIKDCVTQCEAGLCGEGASDEKNQELVKCVADLDCGKNEDEMIGKMIACSFSSCI